jgi:hypothetical protein
MIYFDKCLELQRFRMIFIVAAHDHPLCDDGPLQRSNLTKTYVLAAAALLEILMNASSRVVLAMPQSLCMEVKFSNRLSTTS